MATDKLARRLKELDSGAFEKLCFYLLKEKYPNARVRHVEGASGDLGVDTFLGDLDAGPGIWQAKSFANGIGDSQKEQIRQSLRQVLRHFNPRTWVLCIPIDMDVRTHRWFQRLARSHQAKLKMGLMQGSDLVSELMHRKSIRDYFFPDAGLDVDELRSLLFRTGEYSDSQLAAVTEENAQQYIQRLKDRDARFNYEIVVAADRKPSDLARGTAPTFSIATGSTIINAYPRDVDALKLDPPKLSFQLKETGVAKFQEFIRTGRPQLFEGNEVCSVNTDLALLDVKDGKVASLALGPSRWKRVLPVRLTFGSGQQTVVYNLVKFQVERAGTDEVELVSKGDEPFTLRLVSRKAGGTFAIGERLTGARLTATKKYLEALRVLRDTAEIEFFDLEDDRRLFRAKVSPDTPIPALEARFAATVDAATAVAEFFRVDLRIPARFTPQDAESLAVLKGLMDGKLEGIRDITMTGSKCDGDDMWVERVVRGEPVALHLQHSGMVRPLFGTSISTGPFYVTIDHAVIRDPDEFLRYYRELPPGAVLAVTWVPRVQPRAALLTAPC